MMDVDEAARKLEPLMPEQVRKWLRARSMADSELRSLIDKQILATAQRKLGDPRKKLLLSRPPEERVRGEIHLGTVLYEQPKWPAGISRGQLLRNFALFGMSGSGKTNLLFHILLQLNAKKIPFLFLDWKRTGRHLLPRLTHPARVYTPGRSLVPMPFNPFLPPPGMEYAVYVQMVVDVLAEAYTLGDGARSILHKAILERRQPGDSAPSLRQVIAAVEALPLKQREHGWQVSALRALRSLELAKLDCDRGEDQGRMIDSLLHGSTIIELDALSHPSRRFIIPMLCLWIYQAKLASAARERLDLVIVIEEAHHVLYGQQRARETVLEMLLRQCREIGIGIIVIDQHPHLISSAALGNTYTTVLLNQKDPKDINKAAAIALLDENDKLWLSRLPLGQAVVKLQDRWPQAFLVQIPKVEVAKGSINDAILARMQSDVQADFGGFRGVGAADGQVPQYSEVDSRIGQDGWQLLEDVAAHPDDAVVVRYQRLGLSAGRGHRLKEKLIKAGWLESAMVPVGNSRKLLLRVTRAGQAASGLNGWKSETIPGGGVRQESIEHAYWKRFYARALQEHGWETAIESAVADGSVDVAAQKAGMRLAIEIETGLSDIERNVKRCLRSGFDQVFVIGTDDMALEKIDQVLARAGLLISTRVHLLRAGDAIQLTVQTDE